MQFGGIDFWERSKFKIIWANLRAKAGCFQAKRIKVAMDRWDRLPVNLASIIPMIEVNKDIVGDDVNKLHRVNGDAEWLDLDQRNVTFMCSVHVIVVMVMN